jgi:hypothetical protein
MDARLDVEGPPRSEAPMRRDLGREDWEAIGREDRARRS